MEELVLKSKEGNTEAFTALMLMINNDLYKIAKTRISNDEDINDIIQETMIISFKNIKKLKDASKFKYWIIKILINCCNTKYKKRNYDKNLYEKLNLEIEANYISQFTNNHELIENTLDFYQLLKCLNEDERTIIVLYYNERYTTKEISKIMHIKENTIKSKIARAKEKIRLNYKGGEIHG